jgi:FKBP-type peptidyl-prolyl cis-trans isomerase
MQPVDSIMKKDPRAAQDSFLMAHKGKQFKAIIKVVEVYKDETAAQGIFEKEATDNFYKDPANSRQRKADEAEIDNYLKSKGITATRTPWGAYVQTVSAGNGQKAKMGQFMMLKYTGKDFAGKVFDTNDKPGGQADAASGWCRWHDYRISGWRKNPVKRGKGNYLYSFCDCIRCRG